MKAQKRSSIQKFKIIYLSFGGVGHFPFFPGTMGSLAAFIPLYLLSFFAVSKLWLIILFSCMLFLALLTLHYSKDVLEHKDPSWVVIDEVVAFF